MLLIRKEHGFTMVEVLIAMLIFVVGILGLLGLQGVTMVSLDRSQGGLAAKHLAMAKIDDLQRFTPSAPALQPCTSAWNPNPGNIWCAVDVAVGTDLPQYAANPGGNPNAAARLDQEGRTRPNGRFRRYWHVEPAGSGFPNARNVRVRVDWQDLNVDIATGPTRSITYETILVFN